MSRTKKRQKPGTNPAANFVESGNTKQVDSKGKPVDVNRPQHYYSTRPRGYYKPFPKPRGYTHAPIPIFKEKPTTPCAPCPSITFPSRRSRSASPSPEYHQSHPTKSRPRSRSCSRSHSYSPRHYAPQRDFHSYALRYLAKKAIKHSRKYATERHLERERERDRYYERNPPPLRTRHKHRYGHKPFRKNRTVLQIVGNALKGGFNAIKTLIEDSPLGDSARYCRRRVKRILRPIWCNCLGRICLGKPADKVQRHVYSTGHTVRDRAELWKKQHPRPPTPMPSSPELSSPEPELSIIGTFVEKESESSRCKKEATARWCFSGISESHPPPKSPGCSVCSLLNSDDLPPVGHTHSYPQPNGGRVLHM